MSRINLIQFRKGTGQDWSLADPILASGEPAFNITDYTLKIGDGVSNWSELPNIGGSGVVSSGTDTYIDSGSFNYSSGILTLSYNNDLPDLNINIPISSGGGSSSFLTYKNTSSVTNLSYNDHLIFVDTSIGSVDLYLPLASGYGGKQFIIKQKNGLNPINIYPSGIETIDEQASYQIFYSKNSISVVSDNNNWYII